jgi:hypothetical protein
VLLSNKWTGYWDDTDIGIAQTSTETVGNSLQLIGRGTKYSDSLGRLQLVLLVTLTKGKKFGDLVFINEIHYDNGN